MRNRHGLLPKEADRILESITEAWNSKIAEAEQTSINQPMQGHSRRHYQAIMAALICLQADYSYEEILHCLQLQSCENSILILYSESSKEAKEQILRFNMMAASLMRLFQFLQAYTFKK